MTKDVVTQSDLAAESNENESGLRRRRVYLLRMVIILSILQFVTLVFLISIYPTTNIGLWRTLLIVFILVLAISAAAVFGSWKEAQQIGVKLRDPMTNLFGRDYLEETLAREIHRSQRSQATIGIIMVEIDNLKLLDASYGQPVGDLIMKEFAKSLQQSVRAYDMSCRYDDDKLVLVMNETPLGVTRERAEHLRTLAKNLKLSHEGKDIDGITCSSGVAIYPDHGQTVEALLACAANALDQAKSKGGDQVQA